MSTIRTYEKGTQEYNYLNMMADILTEKSPNGYKYHVGDCYFDMGQDWMWTTIIVDKRNGDSYQALSPVEHERIIFSRGEGLNQIATDILNDKYCPDKDPMFLLTELLVG